MVELQWHNTLVWIGENASSEKHVFDCLWKKSQSQGGKEQECYREIAMDAPKWSRAVNDSVSLRKARKSTAQTEQPI